MSDLVYFLLKLLNQSNNTLVEIVLQISSNRVSMDCIDYPMEAENRELLFSFLPDYIQEIGPIVGVDFVNDVVVVDNK